MAFGNSMRERDGNWQKHSILSGVPHRASSNHILLSRCVATPQPPNLLSSLVLIQASSEVASPKPHFHTCSTTHSDTHPDTHATWYHTCMHAHAATQTLPHAHQHTHSYACTHIHILTLIYKCTLTRGQSKKIITLQRGIDCLLPCQPTEHGLK